MQRFPNLQNRAQRILPLTAIVALLLGSGLIRAARSHGMINTPFNLSDLSSSDRNFGTSVRVNTNEGLSWYPVVAADGLGGVYVAWRHIFLDEETNKSYEPIFFVYSHDFGRSWSKEIIISDNANESVRFSTPSIAVDKQNGYIYVAWQDNRTGKVNGYIDKSTDRGLSFGNDVKVNDNDGTILGYGGMYSLNVAVANYGKVYVAWEDGRADPMSYRPDIFLASSNDSAATFSPNIMVNPPADSTSHRFPWIAVDASGVAYVAYTKWEYPAGDWDVYLTRSLDEGVSFETAVKVNDDSAGGYRGKKEVAVSKTGEICVVWTDGRAGSGQGYWDIYLAISLDGGLSFGPNVRVNDDPPEPIGTNTTQGTPSLAIDGEELIHVVWEDFRNFGVTPTHQRDIYYSYSSDGLTFSKNAVVNYLPNATHVICADPNMDIDSDGNLYVVWTDMPQGEYYIYFAFSPATSPAIESCSSTGTQMDVFELHETVYVNGSGYSPSATYDLYIVVDVEMWTDGIAIPERVPDTVNTIFSNAEGYIDPTAVWNNPQSIGMYDIVVDVNGNGQYDADVDALDDNDVEITAGFVIPEFASIVVIPLIVMATLLSAIIAKKKSRL